MIIEMRTYRPSPASALSSSRYSATRSIPAHAEIGMKIGGPFLPSGSGYLLLLRGFPDLASRKTDESRFYEGELWKSELEAILLPLLDTYEVVLVDDPDGRIRW